MNGVDHAVITLGTFADLCLVGIPLDVACKIMHVHEETIRGRCRVCRLKLFPVIHDGSNGGPRRKVYGLAHNTFGDRTICDACCEKELAAL